MDTHTDSGCDIPVILLSGGGVEVLEHENCFCLRKLLCTESFT